MKSHKEKPQGYESLVKESVDGSIALSLLVEGAYCASCIRKIEQKIASFSNVVSVRLNFTTRKLVIVWEGSALESNIFVDAIEELGYQVQPYDFLIENRQGNDEEKFLLLCMGVAGFALGNIMLLSVGVWSTGLDGMGVGTRDLMHWVSGLIALPTVLFSGRPFFRSAFRALKAKGTNMDVPISVALILTSAVSIFETAQSGEHAYFDSVVMLIFFLLIGRYFDHRARRQARSAASNILGSLAGFASVVDATGALKQIPVSGLEPEMVVRVAVGEKIPADGIIIEGITTLDIALVTGETLPQEVCGGSHVYAGTVNLSSPIDVKIIKAAEDTLLADIVRLIEKSEQSQARYVRLADRIARLYTPVVHVLALLAFVGWMFRGAEWTEALLVASTVLIITCPCALALAVPVVQVLATSYLFKNGILVKSGDALERLAAADTLLIDKTGTLTLGYPVLITHGLADDKLQLAASLASYSSHPLSRALNRAYTGPLLEINDMQEIPNYGIAGFYDGYEIRLGKKAWCGSLIASETDYMEVWFSDGTDAPVRFEFDDRIRTDGVETIQKIYGHNMSVILLSGDREQAVENMAQKAGIPEFHAQMNPVQKYEMIEKLKKQGHKIWMVGDGINDAPALAEADISMSPSTASQISQNTSDIIFMGNGLKPILIAKEIAVFSQKLVKENVALAMIYNAFAIPLAMGGYVTPLIAALAMSGSSIIVIANSFRLRGKKF